MALQMGVWTPLPHTIKAEPRMEAAVERLQRPGSAQGPEDAYEFAVEVLQRGERNGFEITLVAARHLGPDLDAWTLASALAARTTTMKIMVAAHPGIHTPQMIAKMAASLDRISGGRAAINVVNGWNVDEFNLFGNGAWLPDAGARHKRMDEFIQVMKGMWEDEPLNFDGEYYHVEDGVMPLKIAGKLPPQLYATSQSPEGMETIARYCDYWFVADKGDFRKFDETLEFVRQQLAAMGELAGRFGRQVGYCASANVVCADTEEEAIRKAEALEEYGRIRRYNKSAAAGVGFCLVGTPQTIADRIRRYEDAGLDLMLFQFSPMM
jgi:FMNH2-dependent dimethyl sulfone monooxygenase